MKKPVIVAVSGGFDPVHIGHIRMFQEARKLGDELVVILNNDNRLRDKKGFVFMPESERKEVIESIRGVDRVIVTDHKPGDARGVSRTLQELKPDIFANGGDCNPDANPPPEIAICRELGIAMVYGVGGSGKIQSSSRLAVRAAKTSPDTKAG